VESRTNPGNGTNAGGVDAPRPASFLERLVSRLLPGRFLGISLFWKIFLANLILVALVATAGVILALGSRSIAESEVTAVGIVTATVLILLSIAMNTGLVRLALLPVDSLTDTIERVRRGDTAVRAATSPVADPGLRNLGDALNEMLDNLSVNRHRQRELARRVLQAEERERQRIAHELYSGTAQTLAGVLVRLRIAERHLSSGADGSIDEIREEVVSALEEIRGVARRLRPPELDELGVRVALEAHVRSMAEGRNIDIRFEGDVPPLSRESQLALFRIVQEATSNAILHSGTDRLKVRFSAHGSGVLAEVEDDGHGFDVSSALAHTGESLGLFGMHERAGYVQGEISLESGPGRGTRVRVIIPGHPEQTLVDDDTDPFGGTAERLVAGLLDEEPDLAAAAGSDGRGKRTSF
jgi:two-component system sensor histidine kinase UhpB